MKLKATKNDFKGLTVLKVGYCELQFLLYFEDPIAYNSGVYGWNCDIYKLDVFYISTGYKPFGNVEIDHDIMKQLDQEARSIVNNSKITHNVKRSKLNNLIKKLKKHVQDTRFKNY